MRCIGEGGIGDGDGGCEIRGGARHRIDALLRVQEQNTQLSGGAPMCAIFVLLRCLETNKEHHLLHYMGST